MDSHETVAEEAKRWDRDDWKRIFTGITDPELREQRKRIEARKQREKQKVADTGL